MLKKKVGYGWGMDWIEIIYCIANLGASVNTLFFVLHALTANNLTHRRIDLGYLFACHDIPIFVRRVVEDPFAPWEEGILDQTVAPHVVVPTSFFSLCGFGSKKGENAARMQSRVIPSYAFRNYIEGMTMRRKVNIDVQWYHGPDRSIQHHSCKLNGIPNQEYLGEKLMYKFVCGKSSRGQIDRLCPTVISGIISLQRNCHPISAQSTFGVCKPETSTMQLMCSSRLLVPHAMKFVTGLRTDCFLVSNNVSRKASQLRVNLGSIPVNGGITPAQRCQNPARVKLSIRIITGLR